MRALLICSLFSFLVSNFINANDVTVTFNVSSSWSNGHCAEITLTNNTSTDISAWSFVFDLPSNSTISSVWSASYTASGNTITTMTGAAWMDVIPANGGTMSFGYCADDDGMHFAPLNAQLVGYNTCATNTGFDNSSFPPVITITAPGNGMNFPTGTSPITIQADATDSDGTVASVTFDINGTILNATNTSGDNYEANWTPPADGTYTIIATVTDNDGNTNTYTITIIVGNPNAGIVPTCGFPRPSLVGYWQNWNSPSVPSMPVDQVDARYNVVNLSFAVPQGGTTYNMDFVPDPGVGLTQADIINQIQTLKSQGRVVQVSIGGANTTVVINSVAEKNTFVSSMLNVINTYDFDGIDIDLEGSSVSISGGTIATPIDQPVIYLIQAIEEIMAAYHTANGKHLYLTMAPETAYVQGAQSNWGGVWGAYLPIIHALRDSIDLLHVQLYNSGSMYGIDGLVYSQGTADFIVSQTEAVIQGFNGVGGAGFFTGLPQEKISIGLPACNSGAGGGFTSFTDIKAAMDYLLGVGPQPGSYTLQSSYPNLGGLMTWSANWDAPTACSTNYDFAATYQMIFGANANSASCVTVAVKVFLQGPLNGSLMNDDLRNATLLPTNEPYGTGNNEGITSSLMAGAGSMNDDIVDWVLVELRDKNNSASVLATRAALLQRDGDVVDVDGISALHFPNMSPDDYYVAVKHRNHLAVMTSTAITLN